MDRIIAHFRAYNRLPSLSRIDVLDGVRALCVFLVGWFHIWQQGWLTPHFMIGNRFISLDFLLRSGYLWVDGMLLLSGFLLYLPFADKKKNPPIGAFYRRRLIRIVPSYLLCIVPLFILACVRGQYTSVQDALSDLLPHLTFTHTFFYRSYQNTALNGALWTLGVEMQFYLLCPFLARAFKKQPVITWALMVGAAFGFRWWVGTQPDIGMYFNQLPAFLDVYANGFAAAALYAFLHKQLDKPFWRQRARFFLIRAAFTVVCCMGFYLLCVIAQHQAAAPVIQQGQMDRRFPLSLTLCAVMIGAAFALPPIRFALGNLLMRFLSIISFQFYIWHQLLAVKLKEWNIPYSDSPTPNVNDEPWRLPYTLLCFAAAIALATLITFCFERPIAQKLRRRIK